MKKKKDMINKPPHYMCHAMECIDEMVVVFGEKTVYDFCCCCAWKYRYRTGHKDDAEMDNQKSDWYIRKAQELKKIIEGNQRENKNITLIGEQIAIEDEYEND